MALRLEYLQESKSQFTSSSLLDKSFGLKGVTITTRVGSK